MKSLGMACLILSEINKIGATPIFSHNSSASSHMQSDSLSTTHSDSDKTMGEGGLGLFLGLLFSAGVVITFAYCANAGRSDTERRVNNQYNIVDNNGARIRSNSATSSIQHSI
jgi:hypothetical protein